MTKEREIEILQSIKENIGSGGHQCNFCCNALSFLSNITGDEQEYIEEKYFNSPDSVPDHLRGKYWIGNKLMGFWKYFCYSERRAYIDYCIEQLNK